MSEKKNLKIKISPVGAFDMLKFKGLAEERQKAIERAQETEIVSDYPINEMAKQNHPDWQEMRIEAIKEYPGANAKTFVLKRTDDKPAAMFRAGQYVTLAHKIDGFEHIRPYTICSSPEDSKQGKYEVTIKAFQGGFTSVYAVKNYKVGDIINVSGPQGHFYHEPLRDGENVVAAIGGGSITVALAMARAIRDGYEDFTLTILYGTESKNDIICFDALSDVVAVCDKVRLVYVLEKERRDGYENGYITSDLIRKYSVEPYTMIVCGPPAFTDFMKKESCKLAKRPKDIRYEMAPVPQDVFALPDYPEYCRNKRFKLTVRRGGKEYRVTAAANEPLISALERAKIKAPVSCRSGECGFCRSKLVSGSVYIPRNNDFRREADKKYDYIHPCASYPTSDIVLEVPCVYM